MSHIKLIIKISPCVQRNKMLENQFQNPYMYVYNWWIEIIILKRCKIIKAILYLLYIVIINCNIRFWIYLPDGFFATWDRAGSKGCLNSTKLLMAVCSGFKFGAFAAKLLAIKTIFVNLENHQWQVCDVLKGIPWNCGAHRHQCRICNCGCCCCAHRLSTLRNQVEDWWLNGIDWNIAYEKYIIEYISNQL